MADVYKYNPFTGKLDNSGISQSSADARYVKKTGDTMQGILDFSTFGFYMTAPAGGKWLVTILDTGALNTALVTTPVTGNPIGPAPFLWMTYP